MPRRDDDDAPPAVWHAERRAADDALRPAVVAQRFQGCGHVVHRGRGVGVTVEQCLHVLQHHPRHGALVVDGASQQAEDVPHQACALHVHCRRLSPAQISSHVVPAVGQDALCWSQQHALTPRVNEGSPWPWQGPYGAHRAVHALAQARARHVDAREARRHALRAPRQPLQRYDVWREGHAGEAVFEHL